MKSLLAALALLTASPAAAAPACLHSLQAARVAHPTAHISWSKGCYFKGYPGQAPKQAGRAKPERKTGARAVPLPRPIERAVAYAPAVMPPPRWIVADRFEAPIPDAGGHLAVGVYHLASTLRMMRPLYGR